MKKYLIALSLVGLVTSSCYEKLNIAPPNAITDEQVKELLATADDETIEVILGGVAGGLPTEILKNNSKGGALEYRYGSYFGMLPMRSFEGNDVVFGQHATASGFGRDEYALTDFRTANSTRNYPYWEQGWVWVTDANKVLNVVDDKTVGNNATMKKYQAWAYLIRAYAYNWLVDNYQQAYMAGGKDKLGVPYYSYYNPAQPYQARASLQNCYDSINKDLDKAIAGFTADGSNGFTEAKDDLDAGVAYFLKAKVALATGQWSTAIHACDQIIAVYGAQFMSQGQYVAQNIPDATGKAQYYAVNSGFLSLAQNPECILGWPLAQTKDKAYLVYFFNTYGCCSGGSGGNYARIDDRLYDKINENDYRKQNFWVTGLPDTDYEYANGTSTKILPYSNLKFACTVGTGGGTDPSQAKATSFFTDVILMRLSEVYLMKAEAEAQSGTGNAKATLNILLAARTKEGATPLTCDSYTEMKGLSALEMVQLQTRIEMWGENGLEYYNNKRWNKPVDRNGSNVHWIKATTLTVPNMALQIPEESTNYNDLIVQDN